MTWLLSLHQLISTTNAHTGDGHDWPQQYESPEDIAYWVYENGWYISPVRSVPYTGDRLGLFVYSGLPSIPSDEVTLEFRWVQRDDNHPEEIFGPWMTLVNTFELPDARLLVQDFTSEQSSIQFRTLYPSQIGAIEWDIVNPIHTEADENPEIMPYSPNPPPASTYLSQALIDLGVIPRTQWGAQTTTCTSPEDTWYRMAIHHVASQQTYNGSIQQRVQSLQAWAINSGGYCDIPYQYLVGYDGSLWEARPINKYSGATGGGNNNGNIAVSFIGCYDQSACQNSFGFYNVATDAMMARARELIQTLSQEHGIAVNNNNIKSHQDWPGNSTACPGNYIINRFQELLSPVPYYYGTVTGQSHSGTITLTEGESVDVWVDIRNDGQWDWSSETKLAPFPRDIASDLSGGTWVSSTRVTASGSVASGSSHRFSFKLYGNQVGTFTQDFTLVQEWFTWFADTPFAGAPSDTAITFVVDVIPADTPEPTAEPAGEPTAEPTNEPTDEGGSNLPPIANAGIDQQVSVGELVYLNGLASMDPDGAALTYIWQFVEATDMNIDNPLTGTPSFEASELGTWTIALIVQDGTHVATDTVTIEVLESMVNEDENPKQGCQVSVSSSMQLKNSQYFLLINLGLWLGFRRRKQP